GGPGRSATGGTVSCLIALRRSAQRITHAVYRMNQFHIAPGVDLLAEQPDVRVDRIGKTALVVPDALLDKIACQRTPLLRGKRLKERIFTLGKVYLIPGAENAP